MTRATVAADGETITVHIPLTFRKRGGRKLVVTPDAAGRQCHGQGAGAGVSVAEMLDEGAYGTIGELAKSKGIAKTYVSGILRLTLLSPEIVEAILDGRQPAALQLDDVMKRFPLDWEGQRCGFGRRARAGI